MTTTTKGTDKYGDNAADKSAIAKIAGETRRTAARI
jgi:hypothetical protein